MKSILCTCATTCVHFGNVGGKKICTSGKLLVIYYSYVELRIYCKTNTFMVFFIYHLKDFIHLYFKTINIPAHLAKEEITRFFSYFGIFNLWQHFQRTITPRRQKGVLSLRHYNHLICASYLWVWPSPERSFLVLKFISRNWNSYISISHVQCTSAIKKVRTELPFQFQINFNCTYESI